MSSLSTKAKNYTELLPNEQFELLDREEQCKIISKLENEIKSLTEKALETINNCLDYSTKEAKDKLKLATPDKFMKRFQEKELLKLQIFKASECKTASAEMKNKAQEINRDLQMKIWKAQKMKEILEKQYGYFKRWKTQHIKSIEKDIAELQRRIFRYKAGGLNNYQESARYSKERLHRELTIRANFENQISQIRDLLSNHGFEDTQDMQN